MSPDTKTDNIIVDSVIDSIQQLSKGKEKMCYKRENKAMECLKELNEKHK